MFARYCVTIDATSGMTIEIHVIDRIRLVSVCAIRDRVDVTVCPWNQSWRLPVIIFLQPTVGSLAAVGDDGVNAVRW